MKNSLVFAMAVMILALGAAAGPPAAGPAYRTVHLFTPGSIHDERLLLSLLQEFNATFARLGYSGVKYRLWRAEGATSGKGVLMYESTWPSREVYDKVHKEPDYMKLLDKYLPFLQRVLKSEVYTTYVEVETPPEVKPEVKPGKN